MFYLVSSLILYTVVILLGAFASRNANTALVAAVINFVSAIIPIGIVFSIFNKKLIDNGKIGIIAALFCGIAIALFSLALNKSYATTKIGIVAPIVFGGAIFLSTVISAYLFKEKITPIQGIGLFFMGIGFVVLIYSRATGH